MGQTRFSVRFFPETIQGSNASPVAGWLRNIRDGGGGFHLPSEAGKIGQARGVNIGRHQVMPANGVRLAFHVRE